MIRDELFISAIFVGLVVILNTLWYTAYRWCNGI